MYNRIASFKSRFWSWIKEYRFSLFISFMLAVITHGTAIFNKFIFQDESIALNYLGSTFASGRWGLGIIQEVIRALFKYPASLPIINAGFSVLFISLSAIIIQKLFNIKNKTFTIILCAILICSPVISCLFLFMFTAPFYMLGLMLAVGSCYLVCKIKKWYTFIVAVLLQAFSIGIYQSFIPFVLSLLLFYYIVEVFSASSAEVSFCALLKKALYYLAFAGCFIIVYFIVTKASLALLNLELTDYMNINNMGQESPVTYLFRVFDAYLYFISPTYCYAESFLPHILNSSVYYAVILFCLTLMLILVYKGFKKSIWQGLFLLFSVALVPLAINFIFVMVDKETIHTLMMYSSNGLFLLPIILLNTLNLDIRFKKIFSAVLCGLLSFILVVNIYYDNQIYLRSELIQNRLRSNYTTLITRIKSISGYTDEIPVSFIDIENFEDKSLQDKDGLDAYGLVVKLNTHELFLEKYNYKQQISIYTGFTPVYKDSRYFENNSVVQNMPSYPDDGSIQIVDDTIVVKF